MVQSTRFSPPFGFSFSFKDAGANCTGVFDLEDYIAIFAFDASYIERDSSITDSYYIFRLIALPDS